MFCHHDHDLSSVDELLHHDDFRPLVQLLRQSSIARESYEDALTKAQRKRSCCLFQRGAESRLSTLRCNIDSILQILERRAIMISQRVHRSDWDAVVDDIFGAVRDLRFYRGGLPVLEFDDILRYLLNIRLGRVQQRLLQLWDDDGYLSHHSVDWAQEVMKLLDHYDRPFIFHSMHRDDFAALAREFYAMSGREQTCRNDKPCVICLVDINDNIEWRTFCHNHGCGNAYHDSCPVCNGIWITRRYRTGFF